MGGEGSMTSAAPGYVTPEELRKAVNQKNSEDPRLARVCIAVSDAIDWFTGHWDYDNGVPVRMDPQPATVQEVALAWAVDTWKQPDAAFAILGMSETGAVRIPREPYKRFIGQLAPYTVAYGVA